MTEHLDNMIIIRQRVRIPEEQLFIFRESHIQFAECNYLKLFEKKNLKEFRK